MVLHIGGLRTGHRPPEVLATAAETVARRYPVEDRRVDLLGGVPVVTVRFALPAPAGDDKTRAAAWAVVDATAAAVDEVAEVHEAHLACRSARGRWLVVRRPGADDPQSSAD